MGFDVVYLPPIHPIGTRQPQGPATTPWTPARTTPARPWAIGSRRGRPRRHPPRPRHLRRLRRLRRRRPRELGLEVALDLALQAAPDHPWVAEHPEWFTTRADGTIAYAENPPKKYQDIYPLNFDNDPAGHLRRGAAGSSRCGSTTACAIFRVDNPHTKPVEFWEWLIGEVAADHPDVIFLAEAFTRPAMMHALGKVGFQQSYTYFTWRNAKWELEEYLPASWPARPRTTCGPTSSSTHPRHPARRTCSTAARPRSKLRAVLAATLVADLGRLRRLRAVRARRRGPGGEEYIDTEKYEYKDRATGTTRAGGQGGRSRSRRT